MLSPVLQLKVDNIYVKKHVSIWDPGIGTVTL